MHQPEVSFDSESSNIKLEIVSPLLAWHFGVCQQYFTNTVRIFYRDWLAFTQLAGIVIKLRQAKNILGNLEYVGVPVLQRD